MKPNGLYEIVKTKKGQWYARFRAKNGKIIAHTETYKRRKSAYMAAAILKGSGECVVIEA